MVDENTDGVSASSEGSGPAQEGRALGQEIREAVRLALEERSASEAVTELAEERRRREELERQVNTLLQESRQARMAIEESDRRRTVREELERLGVRNVELAYRAVQSDVIRTERGELVGQAAGGVVGLRTYLESFVEKNPELLPARIRGGSGVSAGSAESFPDRVDLESIRPGMPREELERARRKVVEVFSQTFRGR